MTGVKSLLEDLRNSCPAETTEAEALVCYVEHVALQLLRARENAKLTREKLAQIVGISPAQVAQIESGVLRHAPDLQTLYRWAEACGTEPSRLVHYRD